MSMIRPIDRMARGCSGGGSVLAIRWIGRPRCFHEQRADPGDPSDRSDRWRLTPSAAAPAPAARRPPTPRPPAPRQGSPSARLPTTEDDRPSAGRDSPSLRSGAVAPSSMARCRHRFAVTAGLGDLSGAVSPDRVTPQCRIEAVGHPIFQLRPALRLAHTGGDGEWTAGRGGPVTGHLISILQVN